MKHKRHRCGAQIMSHLNAVLLFKLRSLQHAGCYTNFSIRCETSQASCLQSFRECAYCVCCWFDVIRLYWSQGLLHPLWKYSCAVNFATDHLPVCLSVWLTDHAFTTGPKVSGYTNNHCSTMVTLCSMIVLLTVVHLKMFPLNENFL